MIRSKKLGGFTIVELLVVIVVIGILAAVTIISYTGISRRAKVASLNSDLSNASKQLGLFQIDNSAYPTEINSCPTPTSGKACVKTSTGNSLTIYRVSNTNPQTFCIELYNGTDYYSISNGRQPTQSQVCRWFDGDSSTVLSGKYVYYQDMPITYLWGPTYNYCDPDDGVCQTDLDPNYTGAYVLFFGNNYDFSRYDARNSCKSVGGRLPTVTELLSIYNKRSSYGTFQSSKYWSAVEWNNAAAYSVNLTSGNGGVTGDFKYLTFYVRCVKD